MQIQTSVFSTWEINEKNKCENNDYNVLEKSSILQASEERSGTREETTTLAWGVGESFSEIILGLGLWRVSEISTRAREGRTFQVMPKAKGPVWKHVLTLVFAPISFGGKKTLSQEILL